MLCGGGVGVGKTDATNSFIYYIPGAGVLLAEFLWPHIAVAIVLVNILGM